MRGTGKTKLGLCVGVALALSVAGAPGASASEVLALKAGGHTLTNGALVNVTMLEKPEYLFRTKVKVEGAPKPEPVEVECENYLEQGKLQRTANGGWRIVQTTPVEICEGEPWLEEGLLENRLTLSAPNVATDEAVFELFRNAETVRAEERKQAERGEEVDPREPLRCVYTTTFSKGTFQRSRRKPKPFFTHIKGKMAPDFGRSDPGCGLKAKWKGSFTMKFMGMPVFAVLETGPTVSGVSPAEGREAGGTSVTITGSGFSGATAVTFGTTSAASFSINSDGSITAVAPKGTGTVDVTVTTPIATSPTTAADHFTFEPPPTVSEIAPKEGAESGGTEVAITGTNFTGGSMVKFGTAAASSVKFSSSSSITAVAPAGTGAVDVTVTTGGGTSATSAADQFTYVAGASRAASRRAAHLRRRAAHPRRTAVHRRR